MASRPGFHPSSPSSAAAIGSTHCDNILRNFRQEDVVYALMTQLREKESELTLLNEQRQVASRQQHVVEQSNLQLKNKIDLNNKALAEKDTRIALLERKLSQDGRGNESAITEANLKHLTETKNTECKRLLQQRDYELSQLKPLVKELEAKVAEFESNPDTKKLKNVVDELSQVKGELVIAKEQQLTTSIALEELSKKIKGKEWMIKSLQEESDDQRSRENHLLAHIKKLNDKIETYETKFKGKGVDVPMLLAKLKDYEVRTKDFQNQVRRLTNKKLNELVLSSVPAPVPIRAQSSDKENSNTTSPILQGGPQRANQVKLGLDNESVAGDSYSFLANSQYDDEEEEATFATNGTEGLYENYDTFSPKSARGDDAFGEFLSDVKVGIETLEMESLCCVTRTAPDMMNSPTSNSFQSQRSPSSYNSSRTFMS